MMELAAQINAATAEMLARAAENREVFGCACVVYEGIYRLCFKCAVFCFCFVFLLTFFNADRDDIAKA